MGASDVPPPERSMLSDGADEGLLRWEAIRQNMSDARLKDDIVPLGRLENGIRLYRYRYKWSEQRFVGVMAQES